MEQLHAWQNTTSLTSCLDLEHMWHVISMIVTKCFAVIPPIHLQAIIYFHAVKHEMFATWKIGEFLCMYTVDFQR